MQTLLTLLSTLLWWVLYGSIVALFASLVAWPVLRWSERTENGVLFARLKNFDASFWKPADSLDRAPFPA